MRLSIAELEVRITAGKSELKRTTEPTNRFALVNRIKRFQAERRKILERSTEVSEQKPLRT